jgi:truncated hemoglobin YjbI
VTAPPAGAEPQVTQVARTGDLEARRRIAELEATVRHLKRQRHHLLALLTEAADAIGDDTEHTRALADQAAATSARADRVRTKRRR